MNHEQAVIISKKTLKSRAGADLSQGYQVSFFEFRRENSHAEISSFRNITKKLFLVNIAESFFLGNTCARVLWWQR